MFCSGLLKNYREEREKHQGEVRSLRKEYTPLVHWSLGCLGPPTKYSPQFTMWVSGEAIFAPRAPCAFTSCLSDFKNPGVHESMSWRKHFFITYMAISLFLKQ